MIKGKGKCKRCKGTGQIPTFAKEDRFCGVNLAGPSFICCPKCYGKGTK